MKKLYFFLVLAVALFATSCQNCASHMGTEGGFYFVEMEDTVSECCIIYPQRITIDKDNILVRGSDTISILVDSVSCGSVHVLYKFYHIDRPTELNLEVQVQRLKGTGKCTYYFVKNCPDDLTLDYSDSRLHSWIRNNCDTKFTLSDDDVHTIKITI